MTEERFTVGQIGDRLEEPLARVTYIISKLRLKPRQRVGIIRLFDESQIQAIKEGLFTMQIRK